MENRRTNGREAIARKLKFSQEFVMDSKLPSNPDVWTKWHEQRAGTTEMDRDLSNAPNLKYIRIVKEIVQDQYVPRLIEWATKINEEHKKGLHVIKTVVDLRGLKRFKKPQAMSDLSSNDFTLTDAANM